MLESDPSAFDSYDILLYRIGETIKLEDADTYYGSSDSTSFGFTQIELNEDHFLLASLVIHILKNLNLIQMIII